MISLKIKVKMQQITDQLKWLKGVNYYNDGKVLDTNVELIDDYLNITSVVEGSSYSEYHTKIMINTKTLDIIDTVCQCSDFEDSNKNKKKLGTCKHLVATLCQFIDDIKQTPFEKELSEYHRALSTPLTKKDTDTLNNQEIFENIILETLDKEQEKINLEVNLEAQLNQPFTKVDFKIGKEKTYILKSPRTFTEARVYDKEIAYGKDFTYNPKYQYFSEEDELIASFIDEMVAINEQILVVPKHKRQLELIDGKYLNILGKTLRRFILTLGTKKIKLTINNNTYEPKVLKKDLPINFKIEEKEKEIILTTDDTMPIPLNKDKDVYFYDGNIYLPSIKQVREYKNFYTPLKTEHKIRFNIENAKKVITKVIPVVEEISATLEVDENIDKKIRKDLKTEFYLDKINSEVTLDLKLIYTEDDTNNYYIIRDTKKENLIKTTIKNLNFEETTNNNYIFKGDEQELLTFLCDEVKNLKELGQVYYSDKLKYKIETPKINANIKSESDNKYLEINFELENINEKEYKNILKAIKSKSRFYKLEEGVILDLQEEKLEDFIKVMDNLTTDIYKDLSKKSLKLQNNKVIYLDQLLNNDNLDFIKGREHISTLANKIKTKDNIDNEVPINLNATLRNYQIEGLKFLNTLSHYEFGGILADEMGLGKTIQAISFLLANKNKKSLVVTPTSLIYNWKDEFENFAPDLKVLIMHGDKAQRMEALETIDEYDIVLTTYATLRNDFEYYEDRYFDYMIIDEAQNIKNPNALNTETVKNINAKVKFALTGTPIENNLVELWSIFDYLMPGYLFNQKAFESKFVGAKKENLKELKKMINPFILRRLKKDVLTELPDKIEKKHFVEMDKEQKKIYKALIDDINEKRDSEEFKKDKITILSYLTKLRQLCLDPSVLIKDYKGKSAKTEEGVELIKASIEENHKILLFSQFTSVLKNLGQRLEEENISYSYLDGSVDAAKRIELVNEFNEKDDIKVFLISLKAGGTGLNLTSADVVIHFDPWWNPAIEDQATDRAHRFGQKNVVEVIKLIAKGTVEEKIIKMQEDKKELIANVMSGDMNNAGVLSSLSKEDLDELFII